MATAINGDPGPWMPTTAPPGSEEKIRVMEARASRREPIFHRGDAGGPVRAPSALTGPQGGREPGVTRHKGKWRCRIFRGKHSVVFDQLCETEAEAKKTIRRARKMLEEGQVIG